MFDGDSGNGLVEVIGSGLRIDEQGGIVPDEVGVGRSRRDGGVDRDRDAPERKRVGEIRTHG